MEPVDLAGRRSDRHDARRAPALPAGGRARAGEHRRHLHARGHRRGGRRRPVGRSDRGRPRLGGRAGPRGARPGPAVRRPPGRHRGHGVLRDRGRRRARRRQRGRRASACHPPRARGAAARVRSRPGSSPARSPDRVLDEFVGLLLEPFGLRSATVEAMLDGQRSARRRSARSRPRPPDPTATTGTAPSRWSRSPRAAWSSGRSLRIAPGGPPPDGARREAPAGGGGPPGGGGAGPGASGRPGPAGAGGRRDEPAARVDVQLGHARPADAPRVDQGWGDEPPRRVHVATTRCSSTSCS